MPNTQAIIEAKARAWDLIALIERAQASLRQVNEQIAALSNGQTSMPASDGEKQTEETTT
jgi:hypothetical protein